MAGFAAKDYLGTLRISSVSTRKDRSNQIDITVLLGDGPITIDEGLGGGVTTISRPRRVALTTWEGHDPIKLTVPIILGKIESERKATAVDEQVRIIQSLTGRGSAGGDEPRFITISGKGSMVPFPGEQWQVNNVTWSEKWFTKSGKHDIVIGTMELVQRVYDNDLPTQAKALANAASAKSSTYTTQRGDTWKIVAKKKYGRENAKYYTAIRRANPKVKEKRGQLPIGKKLKIPALPKKGAGNLGPKATAKEVRDAKKGRK